MAVGRISGPLLKANLERNGIDLAVETDLLYIDVNNGRIGIKTNTPQYDLDVNGIISSSRINTDFLTVNSNYNIGNVNITSTVGNLVLQASTLSDRTVIIGDLEVTGEILDLPGGFNIVNDASSSIFVDNGSDIRFSDGVDTVISLSSDATHEIIEINNTSTLDSVTGRGNTTTNDITVGAITADGLNLGDAERIQLGASNDLQIYHDGSNSYISEQGTGSLKILTSFFTVKNGTDTEQFLNATNNGAVKLFYDNNLKIETTSTGIEVTGEILVSTIDTPDSSAITITPAAVFNSDVTVENDLTVTNKITASEFIGDGSQLTGLVATYADLTDTDITSRTANSLTRFDGANYVPTAMSEDASGNLSVAGAITVSGTVDGRDVAADGTKLDGIESGATADQTASEILTAIKTVDGASSGLDADVLDGQEGSYYIDWTNTTNKPDPVITLSGDASGSVTLTDLTSGTLTATLATVNSNVGSFGSATAIPVVTVNAKGLITAVSTASISTDLATAGDSGTGTVALASQSLTIGGTANEIETSASGQSVTIGLPNSVAITTSLTVGGNSVLTTANEGSGNGLDADTVDGIEAAALTQSGDSVALTGDVTGTATVALDGTISVATTIAANSVALGTDTTGDYVQSLTAGSLIDLQNNSGESATPTIDVDLSELTDMTDAAVGTDELVILDAGLQKRKAINEITLGLFNTANQIALGTDTTGNYVATIAGTANEVEVSGSGLETAAVTIGLPSNVAITTSLTVGGNAVLTTANEGSGNGLDADTVDGIEAAAITQSGDSVALTGDVTGSTTVAADGTISVATTIAANSVDLGTDTTGNYVATVSGTTNEIEVSGSGSETAAVTVGLPSDVTIGNELTVTTALYTPTIDTTDSSAITVVPAATFNSDVTVENSLTVSNDVNVGSHIDYGLYYTRHAPYQEGRMWYDTEHATINYWSDDPNVVHEIGLEEHQRVYNNTGSTILKGQPLYFTGNYTSGSKPAVPTVGLADATDVNKFNAQGIAAGDIPNNSYGYCLIAGQLFDVDTSALTAGTNFFVGLTPGAVQNTGPVYPNYPMCLGWVVKSDATSGILLVNQQNHSVPSFRVRTAAHIGDDLIVDGDLIVNGTTTSTSSANIGTGAAYIYLNSGDTIGEANTTFTGSGLDDAYFSGHYSGTTTTTYYVRIDSTGTPDTFEWSKDNFSSTEATGVAITGAAQTLDNGIEIDFGATTGHTSGDVWSGTAAPANVDTGFFSNRNTGGAGVGYTHMGLFWDVTDNKWKIIEEYDPEPTGSINTAHASYNEATLVADTFEAASGIFSSTLTLGGNSVLTTANEGSGNGLDADTLDGQEGTYYLDGANFTGTLPNNYVTLGTMTTGNYVATVTGTTNEIEVSGSGFETAAVTIGLPADVAITTSLTVNGSNVLTTADEGSGNGIDADTVDGIEGASLLRSDTSDNYTSGTLTFDSGTIVGFASGATVNFDNTTGTAPFTVDSTTVITNLNADLLDGQQGNYYLDWTNTTNKPDPTITLAGDLTGSVTLTDLTNGTLTATIAANSVALGTDTTGDYVQSLVAGALIDLQNNSGESATPTIDVDLSELTDMTDAAVGTDELVILDAGSQKRKAINEITLGLFDTVNQIALGTDTTGNYVQQGATSGNGISGSVNSEGGTFTVTSNATDANTASTIVFRDASGNFSAGTITAALSGNATTASALASAVTVELTGDVTGSATFTSAGDTASIATTIAANSVELGTDTTGNYVATITGTTNEIEVTGSGSETAAVTIGLPNDVTIGNDLTVTGDLIVNGTTTTVNSNTVEIGDSIITLNSDETGTPSQNAGIEVERGTSTNVQLRWNESNDKWEVTEDGATYSNILTTSDEGSGNGLDADTLDGQEGTYYLDGANFTGTLPNDYVTLGTMTTGNYVATITGTTNQIDVTGSGSETAAVTVSLPDTVTLGSDDTSKGSLYLYGDGTGSAFGGFIRLYNPADHDTTNDYYTIKAQSDQFVVEKANGTDLFTYNNSDGSFRFPDGLTYIGTMDNTKGSLYLTGDGAGSADGGELRIYNAADHDTNVNYYSLYAESEDFLISYGSTDFLQYDYSASKWIMPQSGGLSVTGNITVSGQLEVSTIDTSDSSAITIIPGATFNSDVTVENELKVRNGIENISGNILLPASLGSADQVLTVSSDGTQAEWKAATGGGGGGGGGTLRLEEFPVVNNGSADVTLSQAFSLSQLDVYLNGARLKSTTDFTVSGTTLTFSNTLSTGDVVAVYIYDTSTVLSLVTGDWGSLNDVNVTGQATNTLNKFNGTAYVPALTTEDGSGNMTVTGTVTATSIQGDARDDIIEISTALALALGF